MKRLIHTIVLGVSILSCTGLAQSVPAVNTMTPEARSNLFVKTGGMLRTPSLGATIGIVNVQSRIPLSTISRKVDEMKSLLRLPFLIIEEPSVDVVKLSEGVLKGTNVAVVVAVYDAPGKPSILIAPDARWVLVNVSELNAEGVAKEIQEARLGKQLWRGLCGVLGVGYAMTPDSLLQPIKKMEDLDKISSKAPGMDSWGEIFNQAARMGIQRTKLTTYKKACEEGWAPMPTNAIQKAIWEEVKSKKATIPKPVATK